MPVGEIMLALQCGGSDGYSGITANPALGTPPTCWSRNGGTAILSETPEIYGAEHLLTRRAVSREIGEKLVERIHWWEEYCERNGGEMNNNPSPGNKAGGLTTILEKSLGAAAKGGTTNLVGGLQIRRADHREGLRLHGHARLRPGLGAPARWPRGGNIIVLHHRPRLVLRLQAGAVASSSRPTPPCTAAWPRTWTSTAATIVDGDETIEQMGQRDLRPGHRASPPASSPSPRSSAIGDNEFVPWQIGAVM